MRTLEENVARGSVTNFVACALACALSLLGCAPSKVHLPFACPTQSGDVWSEIASQHFLLRTDLERHDAEETSASLEEMLSVLSRMGFGWSKPPGTRLEVVFFRHHEDGLRVVPRKDGAYLATGLHDFERTPIALLHGEYNEATRRVLQHELTHALIRRAYPQAPVWLNEGLAQYYETLELEHGVATFGRLSPRGRFWNGRWTAMDSAASPIVFIPVEEAPRVKEILDFDYGTFYPGETTAENTWEADKARKAPTIRYAASFSLVRLLLTHADYKAAFAEFRQGLVAGQSAATAWERTIGRIPSDKLEADFRASLIISEAPIERATYPSYRSTPNGVTMSDADVHVLWARLRGWSVPDRQGVAADLAEAATTEPTHRGLALARAALAYAENEFAEAERALLPFAGNTKDAPMLNALGWVKIAALSRSKKPAPAEVDRALGSIARNLEPIASSVAELDWCARFRLLRGELAEAMALERRALEADPSCVSCLVATAEIWNTEGDTQKAFDTASLALNLVPEGAHPTSLYRIVAFYRRKLRSEGASGGGKPPAR